MGLLTKQDIDNFYTELKNEEVVFTKSISSLLGIQPKHIFLKFKDIQRPCIIYSSSMTSAKVIASLPNNIVEKIRQESNINLRFAVNNEDKKNDALFFFVKCKARDISLYKPEQKLYIINFIFLSKPPETLIVLLGRLLEAKRNSSTRSEERIIVDKQNLTKLGLNSTAISLTIDNIPRQAIIRDLSFNGMKLLLSGNSKFLNNKNIKIELSHKNYNQILLLGKSIRADSLVNRKDIVALAVQFDIKQIPVQYHIIINEYLKSNKIFDKIKTNNTEEQNK